MIFSQVEWRQIRSLSSYYQIIDHIYGHNKLSFSLENVKIDINANNLLIILIGYRDVLGSGHAYPL